MSDFREAIEKQLAQQPMLNRKHKEESPKGKHGESEIRALASAIGTDKKILTRFGVELTIGYCKTAKMYKYDRSGHWVNSWVCAIRFPGREYSGLSTTRRLDVIHGYDGHNHGYCLLGYDRSNELDTSEFANENYKLVSAETRETTDVVRFLIGSDLSQAVESIAQLIVTGRDWPRGYHHHYLALHLTHEEALVRHGIFGRKYPV